MPKHSGMAPGRKVTVFEAANDDLKEVYVTWTCRPIFEAMADLGAHPPAAISRWRPPQQRVSFRSLEFGLTEQSARVFIVRRVAKSLPDGWRYVVESRLTNERRRGPAA